MPTPPPILYIANKNYSSWSLRPWLLMRELGLPFEERLVPFADTPRQDAYFAFSPSGRVPCLVDGPTAVWDSLAIVEYLAERPRAGSPPVWPADAVARAWARCAAAEMHSGFGVLRERCTMNCGVRVRADVTPALRLDLERLDALWSDGLARFGGPFLAGPGFSAVDAFFGPVAFRVQSYALPLSAPALAYADRLLALRGMQDWYAAALREPWRDPPHEAEARRAGAWLADLREPPA